MTKHITIGFFSTLVLIVSCRPEKDKRSSALNQYLVEQYQTEIPDSTHFFIVLSSAACSGCVYKTLDWAQKDSLNDNVTCVHLIQGDRSSSVNMKGSSQILTGDFLDASKYDFYAGGVTIFRTHKGTIDTVIYPTFQNIRTVLSEQGILKNGH